MLYEKLLTAVEETSTFGLEWYTNHSAQLFELLWIWLLKEKMNICIGFQIAIPIMRFHEGAYEAIKKHCNSGRILYSESGVCLKCRESQVLQPTLFQDNQTSNDLLWANKKCVIPCCGQPGYCKTDMYLKTGFHQSWWIESSSQNVKSFRPHLRSKSVKKSYNIVFCFLFFFSIFMKVHYLMPCVITAYPVLDKPKTTSACMRCTTEFKFLGQKWIGSKVSEGWNNSGLH